MLEISNGYPNSSSPLGGSPSPGPSPGPIGKSGMLHPPRQHSPIPRTNLRVVIPTVLGPSINQNDDVSYNDVSILSFRKFFVAFLCAYFR